MRTTRRVITNVFLSRSTALTVFATLERKKRHKRAALFANYKALVESRKDSLPNYWCNKTTDKWRLLLLQNFCCLCRQKHVSHMLFLCFRFFITLLHSKWLWQTSQTDEKWDFERAELNVSGSSCHSNSFALYRAVDEVLCDYKRIFSTAFIKPADQKNYGAKSNFWEFKLKFKLKLSYLNLGKKKKM